MAGINAGNFQPVYFVYGDAQLLADRLQKQLITSVVSEAERSFNLDILYGAEVSAQQVLAVCSAFPVMAERRLVIVRDFEKLEDNELLASYVQKPNPHAVVALICRKKPNLTHNPYRAIKNSVASVSVSAPRSNKMGPWLRDGLQERGVSIDGRALQTLKEFVGSDLAVASTELDKLAAFLGARKKVTQEDVLLVAGQTRDINVFELQRAVASQQFDRAMYITEKMLQRGSNDIGASLIIISVLSRFYVRLWQLVKFSNPKAEMSRAEIIRRLGVKDYQMSELQQACVAMGPVQVRKGLRALMAAEFEIKGGSQMNAHVVMTLLLVQLMRNGPKRA